MGEGGHRAGRPRDLRVDGALIEAAKQVFFEQGYQRTSISEVARRAGVGTPAIYRRWHSKAEIAIDLVERESETDAMPDTGAIRDDLIAFFQHRLRLWSSPLFAQVMLPVMMEAATDPTLREEIRRRFVQYREPHVEARIRKAMSSGEVRSDADPVQLVNLLMGTITMPLFFAQDLPDADEVPAIVDHLLEGFAVR